MKRKLPLLFRSMLIALVCLFASKSSMASHIVGTDLYYTWITGNTYRVTVVLYGDCGPSSASAFGNLPIATPEVCVYNGSTLFTTLLLPVVAPSAGVEITPVCPDSLLRTQCVSVTNPIEGIKKFVYSREVVLSGPSANWRFVFDGSLGPAGFAGRAGAIDNIAGAGTTYLGLEATLNNMLYNNTSPSLTVVPTPFFCLLTPICYTPGAIDPESDSLRFSLIPAVNPPGTCAPPAAVTYIGGTSPTNPLRVVAGSFSFSAVNGQVCFNPNVTQRSVVVYQVNEYREGVLIGSCQREMTFLVRLCDKNPPTVTDVSDSGVIVQDGPTAFHICGDAGQFKIFLEPRPDPDPVPPLKLTVTASGVPSGITFSVVGNGTDTPHVTISGDAGAMAPGVYTFFLNLRDNACPLNGNNTIAYSITIYPVPAISHTIVSQADCTHDAVVQVQPGGTGKPWTIKLSDPLLTPTFDTIATFVDSVAFYDTIPLYHLSVDTNIYIYTIYTSVSTECALFDTVRLIVPPKLEPFLTPIDPSHCGKNDGRIVITNLNPGGIDTVTYTKDAVTNTYIAVVDPSGMLTVPNLLAGTYSNMVVHYGYCTSDTLPTQMLVNPPFTLRAVTYQDPTKCGFCDGWIKLHGLHPNQLDTLTYVKDGAPQAATSYFIASDSTITLPGMCEADYTTFTVRTAGVCQRTLTDLIHLDAPGIFPSFTTKIDTGCKADTLRVLNTSTPASDLTYAWDFGDGGTSTEINPVHVYTNTAGTYTVTLRATNTICIDSPKQVIVLNHALATDYSTAPPVFVCQNSPITFTNLSTGTSVNYTWYFADGATETTTDAVHTYSNMGTYQTVLVGHSIMASGLQCYDTTIKTMIVDSNSVLSLKTSGDVTTVCKGQAVTITAIYTTSGQQSNKWSMTDGFDMVDVNPIMHSFEGLGTFDVNFNAKFRACPEKNDKISITVRDVPSLYLGADGKMCPGSSPIAIKDTRNNTTAGAKWSWNTGETTSGILATKPGEYVGTVTIAGCSTSDTVMIAKDCFVDVPNIFTPNGDGVNDYFFPRRHLSDGLLGFKMMVYNRWGQQIYEASSIDGQGWDGALNGVQQPEGVYVYVIEAEFKDGNLAQQKGNVTLMR